MYIPSETITDLRGLMFSRPGHAGSDQGESAPLASGAGKKDRVDVLRTTSS